MQRLPTGKTLTAVPERPMSAMSSKLPRDLHLRLRLALAEDGVTLKDWLRGTVEQYLSSRRR